MVERGPEKAGVGGSIPSLATIRSHLNQRVVVSAKRACVLRVLIVPGCDHAHDFSKAFNEM